MVKSKKNKKSATETTVNYEYDDLYRLKKKDFPTGTDAEFEYDAASRLTKMKDASGEKRFSYDNANRLTKVLQGPVGFVENTNHNTKVEHTWNDANQRTTLTMTIRTLSAKTWTYNFGKPGFLDSIDDPDESNPFGLEYLIDGRLKKITLPNDATREVFYQDTDDNHDFVTGKRKFLRKTLDKTTTPTTICSFTYELDAAGRRKSMTDKDGKYFPYALDPNSQLAAETKWSAKTPGTRNYQYAYAYDANGNRIEEFADGVRTQYTVGDANELISAGTVEFTYDQFLNTATMQDTSSIDPETVFSWDFESNMVGVQYATGDPHADTHEYDATGRRMRSKFDDATDWTNYVYDEVTGNLIAEYTLISGTYTLSATYTWGAGLLKQQRGGTKRFYHFDGSGNSAALSDGSQSITDTYSYNAFGVGISSSGSSVNPYRFGGASGIYDDTARGSIFGLIFTGSGMYAPVLAMTLGIGSQKAGPASSPGCPPGTSQVGICSKGTTTTVTIVSCVKLSGGSNCGNICSQIKIGPITYTSKGDCNSCSSAGNIVADCLKHTEPSSQFTYDYSFAGGFGIGDCKCRCTIKVETSSELCRCCKPNKPKPKPKPGGGVADIGHDEIMGAY